MTDNEIIKALECCMFITPNKKCSECPKFNEDVECSVKLQRHALGLINRQKAEIERLKDSVITSNIMETQRIKRDAKLEVINEFEKEIKYVKENENYDDFNPIVDIDLCENVLDIMKLQNEKIKKLNIKNKELSILINMQEKNIKEQQIIIDTLKTLSESAKLEVIKDFENKLKEKKTQSTMDKRIYSADMIDNIIKEMREVETNPRKEDEGK